LCPFQWMDQEPDLSWLYDFFVRIFHRWAIDLNERQSAELMTALELARASQIRTMTGFMHVLQDRQLRGVIRNYTAGQQWGHIFDGEPASQANQMLTTYEMRRLDILSELGLRAAAPATELIIHDAEVGLGATPTFVIADEAKWILASPISRAWIDKALRTFRKYNAGIILATQSLAEVDNSEVRSILLESTPIKIFLPNRAARGATVRALYQQLGLTEKEIEIIGEITPQRDYLCSTEYGTRMFQLDLGPVARALCAATGANDVAAARALLEEYPADTFLDAWLHHRGLGPAPQPKPVVTPAVHTNGRLAYAS
jgi:type IV secretory pathway VirB4 component